MSEVIAAVAAGIAVVVGSVVAVIRRTRRTASVRPPGDREVTGQYRLADIGAHADLAFIREFVVQIRESQAEVAGDRARELINRETVARMAELLDQHYVASERYRGDARRALQRMEQDIKGVRVLVTATLDEMRRNGEQ